MFRQSETDKLNTQRNSLCYAWGFYVYVSPAVKVIKMAQISGAANVLLGLTPQRRLVVGTHRRALLIVTPKPLLELGACESPKCQCGCNAGEEKSEQAELGRVQRWV